MKFLEDERNLAQTGMKLPFSCFILQGDTNMVWNVIEASYQPKKEWNTDEPLLGPALYTYTRAAST